MALLIERLGLENDLFSKRPMTNKHVRERIDFMERHNVVDERDLATWKRNKTYELEALSIAYENRRGDPIGLGIHLLEYMRLNNIPLKPVPEQREHFQEFESNVKSTIRRAIRGMVNDTAPTSEIYHKIFNHFEPLITKYTNEIYKEYEDTIQETIDNTEWDTLEWHLKKQYVVEPELEVFDVWSEAEKLLDKIEIKIDWKPDDLVEAIQKAIDDFDKDLIEVEHDLEFEPLEEPEYELPSQYDVVLNVLGADVEDANKVREALEWRLDL